MSKEDLNSRIDSFLSSAMKNIHNFDYDSAIDDLKAALVLDKENPEILYNLGIVYSKKGLHKTAVDYYNQVLGLSFSFVDILEVKKMLSYSTILSGNYLKAQEILEEELKKIPNDTTSLNMLGFCYENLEQSENAIEIYQKIIAIDKKNSNAHNSLAYLMAKNNHDLNKSLQYARNAYKANPENAAYLDTMGYVYLQRGEYDMAKKFLKKALEKAPQSLEIRNHVKELLNV